MPRVVSRLGVNVAGALPFEESGAFRRWISTSLSVVSEARWDKAPARARCVGALSIQRLEGSRPLMKDRPHSPRKNGSSGWRRVSDQFGGRHPHGLKTLPRCFLRRKLAHRLAKPDVTRVSTQPWVPDHQEMKWMQLLWRFHKSQGAIPFHHLPHAIGQCEHKFRAR